MEGASSQGVSFSIFILYLPVEVCLLGGCDDLILHPTFLLSMASDLLGRAAHSFLYSLPPEDSSNQTGMNKGAVRGNLGLSGGLRPVPALGSSGYKAGPAPSR